MRFSVILFLLFSTFFFVACQPSVKQQMPDEEIMAGMLQENPDSLANILEEEINPHLLSEAQKADYGRWLVKLHRRQGRSLMNDTLIHFSVDYYKKTDSGHLLETYMVAAEQADWKGTASSEKEQLLNEALQVAQICNDTATVQTIISNLSKMLEMPDDKEEINELIHIAKTYNGGQWAVLSYMNQTKLFAIQKQDDSVMFYVSKGVELAREQNDPLEYVLTRQYVRSLQLLKQDEKALKTLKELEERGQAGTELMLDYSIIWINKGKLDSAQVYIDSVYSFLNTVKSNNNYSDNIEINIVEMVLGELQSIIDIKKGKLLTIDHIGKETDLVMHNSRNMIKNDREQQFAQNKLVRDNMSLDIERAGLKQRFLWAGIGMLFVIVLIVFFYQRKLLRKERSVQQIKEQLHLHSLQLSENESLISKNEEIINDLSSQVDEGGELKQEIGLLVGENEALKQKNTSLQKDIEHYSKSIGKNNSEMVTYEKLVEQNAKLNERERFLTAQLIASTPLLDKLSKNPRYIDVMEWPGIIHAVNLLFDGFSYRLSHDFTALTEEDVQYCCLIKLRLSSSVIATLTGISPSSVTKRKLRIKEKMIQQRPSEIRKDQPVEIYLWKYS